MYAVVLLTLSSFAVETNLWVNAEQGKGALAETNAGNLKSESSSDRSSAIFVRQESADEAAVKKTALDYAFGWYEADAERMSRALHPNLAKRILVKGKLQNATASHLIKATRNGGGKKTPVDKRVAEVRVSEIVGNAACVQLQMKDWVDFLHMSKIDGEWKIVNVLWEFNADAKD